MSKFKKFIPVNTPLINESDALAVYNSIKSGWISSEGPNVKKFETKIAKYIGRKYASAVSSGTAALEVAIKSLSLKKGDEVILPAFTIISNVNAIIKTGAKPVVVDVDIKPGILKLRISKKK